MKYIYAALLLYETGKEINEENLKKILSVIDEDVDVGMIRSLISALGTVDIKKVLESAMAMPVAAPTAPVSVPAEEEKKEEKKEKEKEEEKEEEALEGLGALFG